MKFVLFGLAVLLSSSFAMHLTHNQQQPEGQQTEEVVTTKQQELAQANDLDEKQKARLSKLFDKVDENQDGKLTSSEFQQFKSTYEIIPEETNEEQKEETNES